jgi:hypothetical protein
VFYALVVHLVQLLRATFVRAYPREHLTISLLSWKDAAPLTTLVWDNIMWSSHHFGKCPLPSPFNIILPHRGRGEELASSCIVANTAYEHGAVNPPNENLRSIIG